MTDVLFPRTLPELFDALALPGARVLAGGTDLLVRLRAEARRGLEAPPVLVGLERLPELCAVEELPGVKSGGGLRLGAASTHASLLADARVRQRLPVLARALAELGSPPIRNMGTLGGNLCTASPAGDCLTPLAVLGARVELAGASGVRRLPLAEFITGPGRTALLPGEVLTAVIAPSAAGFGVQHFEKVGRRGALAIAVVSLAALAKLGAGGRVEDIRLAWGSVGPTVWRCPEAEDALRGKRLTLSALSRAAEIVRERVRPIDDIRAGADYRRQVAGNLLLRLAVL